MRLASEGGSESERKLASALVAIAAHLIAQIGESDAVVGISEGELSAGAGMAEAPRAQHRLRRGRGELEAGAPSRPVVWHT